MNPLDLEELVLGGIEGASDSPRLPGVGLREWELALERHDPKKSGHDRYSHCPQCYVVCLRELEEQGAELAHPNFCVR